MQYDTQQWQLLDQQGDTIINVDAVVVASGPTARRFWQTAHLPIQSVRGQISYLPSSSQSRKIQCPICYEGYLLPDKDGQHVMGASFKPDDDTVELTQDEHSENIAAAEKWLGKLLTDVAGLEGRAAVRAVTPDRMPIIGPVADLNFYLHQYSDLKKGRPPDHYPVAEYHPGLYVNTGHGARGLTSSFLSAELLAAQMNAEPLPVYENVRQALHPARFIIRALKKGHAVTS